MQWLYLASLLISIVGLAVIDRRFKLAFFRDFKRSALTIISSVLLFVVWDVTGIISGVFFRGNSKYDLPYELFREFPLEELFFLTLLSYSALLLYLGGRKLWPRT